VSGIFYDYRSGSFVHYLPMMRKLPDYVVKYALMLVLMVVFHEGFTRTLGDGIFDFRSQSLAGASVSLDGFWQFYPNQLLRTNDSKAKDSSSSIRVPSWWSAEDTNPSLNYASYRLTILLSKEDQTRGLAIKMPPVYSSYTIYVDGVLLGGNGKPGTTAASTQPQWKPQTYSFIPKSEKLEIIIHIANFHHHRTGINESIYLGDGGKLSWQKQQTEISGTVLFIILWVFAFVSLGIRFFTARKDPAFLYYACLCIAWSFRSVFSNYYLAVQWFPDMNWSLCAKVEYVTLCLSVLFGSLLIDRLFPRDVHKLFRTIYGGVCLLFILFTLVTPPLVFSTFVQLYVALSALLLGSILVIITKAYIESRHGLSILIVSMFLAVVMFGYVILAYQGLFELNILIFNGGFVMLFLLSGFAVSRRLNKMATTYDYDLMTIEQFRSREK
jgi:hypothetical protein